MSRAISLTVSATPAKNGSTLVLFTDADMALSKQAKAILGSAGVRAVERAAGLESFKGKAASCCMITAPAGTTLSAYLLVGIGAKDAVKRDFAMMGGAAAGALAKVKTATVVMDKAAAAMTADEIGEFALGVQMRAYAFDLYKTVKREEKPALALTLVTTETAPPRLP